MENYDNLVGVARALDGATPFGGSYNTTFKGQILTNDGVKFALIKDGTAKESASELLVAALAKLAKVAVPNTYLTLWPSTNQATFPKAPRLENGDQVVIASEFMSTPAMGSLFVGASPSIALSIIKKLSEWPHLHLLYALDSYVANVDRHLNNILFDGQSDAWLIDHGHCFSGPSWSVSDLEADKAYPEQLSGWLSPQLSEKKRDDLATKACILETILGQQDIDALSIASSANRLLSPQDYVALVNFIKGRISHIPVLSAKTLLISKLA